MPKSRRRTPTGVDGRSRPQRLESFQISAGVQRLQVQQLPANLQTSQQWPLEERTDSIGWRFIDSHYASNYMMVTGCFKFKPCRNKLLLQSCFFPERFTQEYVKLAESCVVYLAIHYPWLLQLGLHSSISFCCGCWTLQCLILMLQSRLSANLAFKGVLGCFQGSFPIF